jgi:hypothetical protein
VPLTFAVAVSMTLNVPDSLNIDPNREMFVPSILIKDGTVFNVYVIVSLQAGI